MHLEKKFIENFLTKRKYNYSSLVSVVFISICCLVSQLYWTQNFDLAASPSKVFLQGDWWKLFTTTLVHGDLKHLMSNSLSLFFLSYFVVSQYGIYIFPLLSFFMGGLINLFVLSTYEQNIHLVGASGVVFFLWGFWLILYILIQKHISLNRRFMKVFAIAILMLIPTSFDHSISYLAHYSGLLLGIICGFLYYLLKRDYIHSFTRYALVKVEDYQDSEGINEFED